MDRRTMLMGGGALIAAAGGYYVLNTGKSDLPGINGAIAQADLADIDTSMVQEMSLGNPDAAVTVVEYASFTCPHCRAFHMDQLYFVF